MAGSPRAETGEIRHEIRTCLTAPPAVRAGPCGGTDRFQRPPRLTHAGFGSSLIGWRADPARHRSFTKHSYSVLAPTGPDLPEKGGLQFCLED